LETFTELKALVENPHFHDQRQKCLAGLNDGMIDKPIIDLINSLNKLPHIYTLQCCYGHFIYSGQNDPNNLNPLLITDRNLKSAHKVFAAERKNRKRAAREDRCHATAVKITRRT
jgi:tRNA(Phe) wybutosine-synthesizing methylase Tyw3